MRDAKQITFSKSQTMRGRQALYFAVMATTAFVDATASSTEVRDSGPVPKQRPHNTVSPNMKIRLTIDGHVIVASLADNPTSKDFASLLPLDLTLGDYAATEKISDLPRRLNTTGAPSGYQPRNGDITYYSPWGNLALFHKDFRYSEGLIKLGSIDAGSGVLRKAGPLKVRIELAEAPPQ
jgi:hypothetical protein